MIRPVGVALLGAALFTGCETREVVVVHHDRPAPVIVETAGNPPPPQVEVVGVAPWARARWVRGHWVWRRGHWVWIRGHWV